MEVLNLWALESMQHFSNECRQAKGFVPGIASLQNTLLDFRAGALEKGFPWEKRLQWFLDKSSKAEIIQFLAIQWPNYFWQHFLSYGYLHLITVDIFAYCVCSQNFRVMRDCWPNKWLLQFAKRKDILNQLRVNRKDWLLTDFKTFTSKISFKTFIAYAAVIIQLISENLHSIRSHFAHIPLTLNSFTFHFENFPFRSQKLFTWNLTQWRPPYSFIHTLCEAPSPEKQPPCPNDSPLL